MSTGRPDGNGTLVGAGFKPASTHAAIPQQGKRRIPLTPALSLQGLTARQFGKWDGRGEVFIPSGDGRGALRDLAGWANPPPCFAGPLPGGDGGRGFPSGEGWPPAGVGCHARCRQWPFASPAQKCRVLSPPGEREQDGRPSLLSPKEAEQHDRDCQGNRGDGFQEGRKATVWLVRHDVTGRLQFVAVTHDRNPEYPRKTGAVYHTPVAGYPAQARAEAAPSAWNMPGSHP